MVTTAFTDADIADSYHAAIRDDDPSPRGIFGAGYSIIRPYQASGKPRGGFRVNGGRWSIEKRAAMQAQIVSLANGGMASKKIARLLGISRTSVLYYRRKL